MASSVYRYCVRRVLLAKPATPVRSIAKPMQHFDRIFCLQKHDLRTANRIHVCRRSICKCECYDTNALLIISFLLLRHCVTCVEFGMACATPTPITFCHRYCGMRLLIDRRLACDKDNVRLLQLLLSVRLLLLTNFVGVSEVN